jgi:phage recombination protein Bet
MNAIVKSELPRKSLIVDMAAEYGMDPDAFQKTLKATVVPANVTNEDFAAFLLVAKHYRLNPILKEIFAFPKRGGGIQPIVSVDGWANLINSHSQCDGFSFADNLDPTEGLTSITCTMHRKDRKHPVTATEYMAECKRDTDTWAKWPRRMLRHKALIQAARYAFGFAGILEPDEAERTSADHYEGTPGARLTPPPAPVAQIEQTIELSEAAYAGNLQDAKDELEGAETEEAIQAVKEKWLDEMNSVDRQSFLDRAAERAAEIFGANK